jgi:hypothetical protein
LVINHGLNAIGGEHFEGGAKSRFGQSMGIHAKKEWAGDADTGAMIANGLGNGEDMGLVKAGGERVAAMPGCAKSNALGGVRGIRYLGKISRYQPGNVGKQRRWHGLAGQRAERMGHETLRGSRPDVTRRDYKRDIRSV